MTFIQSQYQTDENRDLGKHIFKRWQNYIMSRPYIIKNSRKNTKKIFDYLSTYFHNLPNS